MSTLPPNPNADMFNETWASLVVAQAFNVTDATGVTDTFSFQMLDAWMNDAGKILVISGVSIGMTAILIIVLLLLTRPEKRRTPVFVLNLAALFFMCMRMLFNAISYNGSPYSMSTQFLDTNVLETPAAVAGMVLYGIFTILWYAVILLSMVLQVRVVFAAETKLQNIVTAVLALPALATFASEFLVQVLYIKTVQSKGAYNIPSWYGPLGKDAYIVWGVTIGLASLIFVCKLLYLTHKRKKMGFKGFGPLQVITVMGTECLIVPLIFVILSFYVNITGFVTVGETLVTCSLPLSALWASFEATKSKPGAGVASLGPFGTSSSAGAVNEVAASSKRSFFGRWRGSSKGTYSDDRSDVEKGSFSEESDHVMVQKTLHVVSSESPKPPTTGSRNW